LSGAHFAQDYDRHVTAAEPLDDIDRLILDRLRQNARESASSIARRVNLTPSAVRRRIARLERTGVIDRYTVSIKHDELGASIEAFVELSFAGDADVHTILKNVMQRREVREAMTITGETDALVRVRVRDLAHLRQVVMDLRTSGPVVACQTRVIIGRWWHGSTRPDEGQQP
jgi:Lrp/AsnC family leucine-responsive transcriptional regulator